VAGRWNTLSGLPLSLFGIVLVAVGEEIPDTISSLDVARRGYGSMAVANSCGSQITNILFGLGLPWTMANVIGSIQVNVAGIDPCESWDPEEHNGAECPPEVQSRYGYDVNTGKLPWRGVQVADHNDVIIAAGFQFFILFIFISTLLLAALAMRRDKATLNKKKGVILVCGYAAAVIGYMIVSRGIVQPATEEAIYPTGNES